MDEVKEIQQTHLSYKQYLVDLYLALNRIKAENPAAAKRLTRKKVKAMLEDPNFLKERVELFRNWRDSRKKCESAKDSVRWVAEQMRCSLMNTGVICAGISVILLVFIALHAYTHG